MNHWFRNNSDVSISGTGEKGPESIARILDELRSVQTVNSLRPVDRLIIYIGCAMSSNLITNDEIASHVNVLNALAPTAQTQRHVIAAFEWFCGRCHREKLHSKFPIVLKLLFDNDVVDEDTFYDWSADYTKNDFTADDSLISIDVLEELKESARPFITWLREADEEGETDDSEENDDD